MDGGGGCGGLFGIQHHRRRLRKEWESSESGRPIYVRGFFAAAAAAAT